MALTKLTASTAIVAALSDEPNTDDGLTAAQLKAKFDEAATSIKTYINSTLTSEIDVLEAATVTLTGTQTLTNKTLTTPVVASVYQDAAKTKLLTVPDTASDTLAAIAATQTLTNKTLTTPIIPSIYQDAGKTKLLTIPDTASDTLAAIAATQTLTNKTLTTPIVPSIYQDAGKTKLMTLPDTASDTIAALAATQTLTNKTLTTPVVASMYQDAGKTKLMTLPDTASDTLVSLGATQTLTAKTLTSPVLNTGVSGTAIDTDALLAANSDTLLSSQKAIKTNTDRAKGNVLDLNYYYQRNTKLIDLCTNANYTTGAGTQSPDTTNTVLNGEALKILENDNEANSLLSARNNISSIDLTKFTDGSASTTNDYICLVYYVSDAAKVTSIRIDFSKDAVYAAANRYYDSHSVYVTGWNYKYVAKSVFTNDSGDWADIKSIRLLWSSAANAQNAYVTFQSIQLIRKDPSSAIPNPFQRFVNGAWTRDFAINSGAWYVGLEYGVLICKNLIPATSTTALMGTAGYTDFNISQRFKCLSAGFAYGVIWYIDSSNDITCFIDTNTISLKYNIAGSITTVTQSLTVALNDIVRYKICKSGSSTIVYIYLNNSTLPSATISAEIALTGIGYLGCRSYADKYINLLDNSITTTDHAEHSNVAEIAKTVSNDWKAWTPTATWTTGTPEGSVAQTARYTVIGNTCFFNYSYTATDGNGATALTITLPVTPKDNNAMIALTGIQKQNATYTALIAYIDDDSGGIAFRNLATMTNAEAVEVIVTGQYEV